MKAGRTGARSLRRVVDSGLLREVFAFVRCPADLCRARCASRVFGNFFKELTVLDIGLPWHRPFLSSERASFDIAIRSMLAGSPRLTSLVLSNQTHVSGRTFRGVDLKNMEHLWLHNCFRIESTSLASIISRTPRLLSLDLSSLMVTTEDLEPILQRASALRTLRLDYKQLTLRRYHLDPARAVRLEKITRLQCYDRSWHPTRLTRPFLFSPHSTMSRLDLLPSLDRDILQMQEISDFQRVNPGIRLEFYTDAGRQTCADVDARLDELATLKEEAARAFPVPPPS